MVKSVLGVNHQGLREWAFQRLTAIFMAVYLVAFCIYLLRHPSLSFDDWHTLFRMTGVKIATILLLLAIVYHAWVGLWTIFTDYVKCYVLRCIIHTVVLLSLAAFLIAGVMILWSV